VEDVEQFRKQYVFARDIAANLRTSSRRVGSLLADEGIYPIRGHTVTPPRMVVYLATDELRRFLATMGIQLPFGDEILDLNCYT